MAISDVIAEYLKRHDVRLKELNARAYLPDRALHNLVNGKRDLKLNEYVLLCDALKLPYDYFFTVYAQHRRTPA